VDAVEEEKHIFQHPRGEPLRRSVGGDLFKMHKPKDHWETIRRSKSYMADDYFPPFALRDGGLNKLFESDDWKNNQDSPEYQTWKENLIELIPRLNFDMIVDLSLYLAFQAQLNDKYIWRAIEEAALANLHFFEVKHASQMQWAVT
jgi:hypothetical protein